MFGGNYSQDNRHCFNGSHVTPPLPFPSPLVPLQKAGRCVFVSVLQGLREPDDVWEVRESTRLCEMNMAGVQGVCA